MKFTASDISLADYGLEIVETLQCEMVRKPPARFPRTLIRQRREELEMTLEELGGIIDMTASHISMLERGERGYTQKTLQKIALALKTTTGALMPRGQSEMDQIMAMIQQAKPLQRKQIFEVVKTLTKTTE